MEKHQGLVLNELIGHMGFMVNCTNYGEVIVLLVVDRGGDRDFEDFGPVNDGWVEGEEFIKANSVRIDIFPAGVADNFEEALQKLRDKLALIPKDVEREYNHFLIEMRDARREAYAALHQNINTYFEVAPAVQKLVDDFKRDFLSASTVMEQEVAQETTTEDHQLAHLLSQFPKEHIEGQLAYLRGKPSSANPHLNKRTQEEESAMWLRGYKYAAMVETIKKPRKKPR